MEIFPQRLLEKARLIPLMSAEIGWETTTYLNTKTKNESAIAATLFPGTSLFLPRESTLVAAGHVST